MNQPPVVNQQPVQQSQQDGNDILTGPQYNKALEDITNMGFDKELVAKALKAAYNNPDRAIDYLLNGIPE